MKTLVMFVVGLAMVTIGFAPAHVLAGNEPGADERWTYPAAPAGPTPDRVIYAITKDSTGQPVVGSRFAGSNRVAGNYVGRWDGEGWKLLGQAFNGQIMALTSGPDGALYAGGLFNMVGATTVNHIARWDGRRWRAMDSGFNGAVRAIVVDGTNVYAGGTFVKAGATPVNGVAHWDGSNWEALDGGVSGAVLALAFGDDTLYAGGWFTSAGGEDAHHVAQWNGAEWTALGSGTNGSVRALAAGNGVVYAAGYFNQAGDSQANRVARWAGGEWSGLGGVRNGFSGSYAYVHALALATNGDLYAGGDFRLAGQQAANNIARWNGSAWQALGSGVDAPVRALSLSGRRLYVGGEFTTANLRQSPYFATWSIVRNSP